MPYQFVVVCEAEADFAIATHLAERVIIEQVDWIDEDQLQNCPLWVNLDRTTRFLKWKDVKELATQESIPPILAAFEGRRGEPDARNAKRALQLFKRWRMQGRQIDGVFFVRDDDGDPGRLAGLNQARSSEDEFGDHIVIGVAQPKRECWVLAGFAPLDQQEANCVAELRQKLSFDPCLESHRLTAKPDHEVRSAKRVLNLLTEKNYEREEACWRRTSLETLRERGESSGLTAFLAEVEDRLVPLFTGRPFERS